MVYGLIGLGVVVLFVVFIGFKDDAALVAALSAAGTVLAAGFAAIAAMGSMRAAAESSATARQAREAFARSVRPRLQPIVVREDGALRGELRCGPDRAAIDLTVVWMRAGHETLSEQFARIEPGATVTVDLGLPDTAAASDVEMVWVEYWDDGRAAQWQDTWRPDATRGADAFVQSDSRLVD